MAVHCRVQPLIPGFPVVQRAFMAVMAVKAATAAAGASACRLLPATASHCQLLPAIACHCNRCRPVLHPQCHHHAKRHTSSKPHQSSSNCPHPPSPTKQDPRHTYPYHWFTPKTRSIYTLIVPVVSSTVRGTRPLKLVGLCMPLHAYSSTPVLDAPLSELSGSTAG